MRQEDVLMAAARSVVLLAVLVMLASAGACADEPNSKGGARELGCVRTKAFQNYLALKIPVLKVAPNGGIHRNAHAFSDVAAQRTALLLIFDGVSKNDKAALENGVRALTMPFEFQKPDGTFQCPAAGNREIGPKDMYGEAMFIGAIGEAVLVLGDSPYGKEYVPKILAFQEPIKKWLSHFMSIREVVLKADRNFGNRLGYDALALLSFGVILNDKELVAAAEMFLQEAMKMQTEQGYYPDNGGPDTSYNAVTAWKLQVCSLYVEDNLRHAIHASVRRAMAWEMARIDIVTGEVSVAENVRTGKKQEVFLGKAKDVNYEEVAYALFFWETIGTNPSAGDVGTRVLAFGLEKSRR